MENTITPGVDVPPPEIERMHRAGIQLISDVVKGSAYKKFRGSGSIKVARAER